MRKISIILSKGSFGIYSTKFGRKKHGKQTEKHEKYW